MSDTGDRSTDSINFSAADGTGLSNRYSPDDVEGRIYGFWESSGHFKSEDRSTKTPYCIILPPPNVTGALHLGHGMDHTIQDVVARHHRMMGMNVNWLPGTDHAGIATQNVVEKELRKEGKHRKDLGREKFVEKVWEWKRQYGDRITLQMRRLGNSCDWDRLKFTLDDDVSKAVRKVFVQLYKENLIYQGIRLVNWCTRCETAISDLEVDHQESKGNLWHIKYPVEGTSDFVVVATTRPETMLGDTAVCVHPEDERYKDLIGKSVVLPLVQRKIPIIADEYVDKEFGSGVVKITPGHDFNDYEIGKRHKLSIVNLLSEVGTLNENAGPYLGMKVADARKKVLEDLATEKLLEKEETHTNNVGRCQRCQTVIEPFLSKQWYVAMKTLAKPAVQVIETETIKVEPEMWVKTYLHWMNNIQDWCISRQLWWGHRIPAWTCEKCQHVTVSEDDPSVCEKCQGKSITQDEDVLDTWFSSGLWPFSTLGWPKETEALKTFYPTNLMVTGHDILFFWVARMIMMGIKFMGDVPFRHVYLHGIVRDAQGKKMSKSSGNALDPLELIEKYGADAFRFTIMSQLAGGRDLKFSEKRLEGYRNFMNKIWNASRFALAALGDFKTPGEKTKALPNKAHVSVADQWIVWRTAQVEKEISLAFEDNRFSDAAMTLYAFVWNDFCDWYLEFIKPVIYGSPSPQREATQLVLAQTLNRLIRLLHPFVPFITEEIYAKLPIRGADALIIDEYPTPSKDKAWLSLASDEAGLEFELVKETVAAVRNIRGENQIKPSVKINVRLATQSTLVKTALTKNLPAILRLAGVADCKVGEAGSLAKCAVSPVVVKDATIQVIVPLEGLVDIGEEITRLQKNIDKLQKEIDGVKGRLGNENFVKNAPEDIVTETREALALNEARLANMQGSLDRLK